jgi:hypothetical protein
MDITKAVGAGIMVIALAASLAGVYQLTRDTPHTAPDAPPLPRPVAAPVPAPPVDPDAERLAQIRRELEAYQPPPENTRCIGGTLMQVHGNAWTNIGRC